LIRGPNVVPILYELETLFYLFGVSRRSELSLLFEPIYLGKGAAPYWIEEWVSPRTGWNDVGNRRTLPLSGIEPQSLCL